MLGLCSDTLRMPLMPLEESHRARLRLIMEAAGLLDPDNLVAIGSAAAGRTGARAAAAGRTGARSRTTGAASAASSART